jgi:hypothetical protein
MQHARASTKRVRLEMHFFCPCKARLGKASGLEGLIDKRTAELEGRNTESRDTDWVSTIELEPRYTSDENDKFPRGTWWRRDARDDPGLFSGLRGRAFARARREKSNNPMNTRLRPLHSQRYYRHLEMQSGSPLPEIVTGRSDVDRSRTGRRQPGTIRVPLPDGSHVVVCYQCEERVIVEGRVYIDLNGVR